MSTHSVQVVEIDSVETHPNADLLEIVRIGVWSAVVKKGDFKPGSLGIYIEPDYVVPVYNPLFSFLKQKEEQTHARLKAKKIRGVISYGLLIPLPSAMSNLTAGTDVMDILEIKRYEPPVKEMRSLGNINALRWEDWPKVHPEKFDLESYAKYSNLIPEGTEVIITEKIDGTNARFTWHNGEMYAASRNYWLKPEADNVWNSMKNTTPEIVYFCAQHPNYVLYGEIFGPIQSLKYGFDTPQFSAFAIHDGKWWVPYDEMSAMLKTYGIRKAPELMRGPWEQRHLEIAERDSIVATKPGHMMEGIVITTPNETKHPRYGRIALKHISNRFWLS